jgi:hypothetical protein
MGVVSNKPQLLYAEGKEVGNGLCLHQEMDVYVVTLDPQFCITTSFGSVREWLLTSASGLK